MRTIWPANCPADSTSDGAMAPSSPCRSMSLTVVRPPMRTRPPACSMPRIPGTLPIHTKADGATLRARKSTIMLVPPASGIIAPSRPFSPRIASAPSKSSGTWRSNSAYMTLSSNILQTSQPPSTVISCPVILRLSSLARNSTASAMSCGSVTRFRIMSSTYSW